MASFSVGKVYGHRDFVSDRAVGSVLVIVSTPIRQLFADVWKAYDLGFVAPLVRARMATNAQTLRPELAIERLNGIRCPWVS